MTTDQEVRGSNPFGRTEEGAPNCSDAVRGFFDFEVMCGELNTYSTQCSDFGAKVMSSRCRTGQPQSRHWNGVGRTNVNGGELPFLFSCRQGARRQLEALSTSPIRVSTISVVRSDDAPEYLDDEDLSRVVAHLDLIGLLVTESRTIVVDGQDKTVFGLGDPQVMHAYLPLILTGGRVNQILMLDPDPLGHASHEGAECQIGVVCGWRLMASTTGLSPSGSGKTSTSQGVGSSPGTAVNTVMSPGPSPVNWLVFATHAIVPLAKFGPSSFRDHEARHSL